MKSVICFLHFGIAINKKYFKYHSDANALMQHKRYSIQKL